MLRLGDTAEVLEPAEMHEQVDRAARAALANYG